MSDGNGLGDLGVLPPGIRLEIYKMVPSDNKRRNLVSPCHWPRPMFDTSILIRTVPSSEMQRSKAQGHNIWKRRQLGWKRSQHLGT